MRAYVHSRQRLPYASSRSARWLFPGRQPGRSSKQAEPGADTSLATMKGAGD